MYHGAGKRATRRRGAKRIVGASLTSFQSSTTTASFASDVVYFTH